MPTVTGFAPCDALGVTLMHEHVLFGDIPSELRSASVDFAVKLLNDAARVGIDTLVDLTPVRDIQLYQEIAQRTSVKIAPSTGSYIRSRMPKYRQEMNEQQMEERMLREVTAGIEGTKIRAGIIKVAGEKTPLTDWELHCVFGLRPGFYPWMFEKNKVILGLEGDLPTITCMLILRLLTGDPVLFGEYLNYDKPDNTIVVHHTGV